MSLAAVVVAVTAGIFTVDYTNNYDPFSDSKYANNISTATADNIVPIYDGDKEYTITHSYYPEYTFKGLIDDSDNIIIGTVTKVSYVIAPFSSDPSDTSVGTDYTITVLDSLKGKTPNEILVSTNGGVTKNYYTDYGEKFVYQKGDKVLLMLDYFDPLDADPNWPHEIVESTYNYTPNTPAGMYKIISNSTNSEVHKYGESTSVPLPDFKSIIRSIVG